MTAVTTEMLLQVLGLIFAVVGCASAIPTNLGVAQSVDPLETLDVNIMKTPYLASIHGNGKFVCSGVVIGWNWILSVASCLSGLTETDLEVRVGSGNALEGGELLEVGQIIRHENRSEGADLALLELKTALKYSAKVLPVRLAAEPPVLGHKLHVAGWGAVKKEDVGVLRHFEVKLMDKDMCQSIYENNGLSDFSLCTDNEGGVPCWGDFGDPLVNEWGALVGVFSWTKACDAYPSVFTSVVPLRSWIIANTPTF